MRDKVFRGAGINIPATLPSGESTSKDCSRSLLLESYGDTNGVRFTNFVELFYAMKQQDPESTLNDLDFLVETTTGLHLVDLLEEEESRQLLPFLADNEVTADAIFEGLGAFP